MNTQKKGARVYFLIVFISFFIFAQSSLALVWSDSQFMVDDEFVLYLDDNGNVGIKGYSISNKPNYDLEVGGEMQVNNTLFVSSTAEVGIKTLKPSNALDIRGDLNVSGAIWYGNHTLVTAGSGLSSESINLTGYLTSEQINTTGYLTWDGLNSTILNSTFAQYDTWNYNQSAESIGWVEAQNYLTSASGYDDTSINATISSLNSTQNLISLGGALNVTFAQYDDFNKNFTTLSIGLFGLNDTFLQYNTWGQISSYINTTGYMTSAGINASGYPINSTFAQYDDFNRNFTTLSIGLFGLNDTFSQYNTFGQISSYLNTTGYLTWDGLNSTILNSTFAQYDDFNKNFTTLSYNLFGLNDTFKQYDTKLNDYTNIALKNESYTQSGNITFDTYGFIKFTDKLNVTTNGTCLVFSGMIFGCPAVD